MNGKFLRLRTGKNKKLPRDIDMTLWTFLRYCFAVEQHEELSAS